MMISYKYTPVTAYPEILRTCPNLLTQLRKDHLMRSKWITYVGLMLSIEIPSKNFCLR